MQSSFKSVWNFGDAQKQDVEEPFNRTDCRNYLKIDESCSISEDSQDNLENDGVQHATGEVLVEGDQTNKQTLAVCVSLLVNGDAHVTTASSSASLSRKALSDDAVIKVDAVQADQLNFVENSTEVELEKEDEGSEVKQNPVTTCAKCGLSGQMVDCSYLHDGEQLRDKEACCIHHSEIHDDGADYLVENKQHAVIEKWYKDNSVLDNEESVSAVHETGVLNEVSEAVVDELVSTVTTCEDGAPTDGSMCNERQDILARELHQYILHSGDSVLVTAHSRSLKAGQKFDDLAQGKYNQDLSVRARDVVSESTHLDEISDLSSDCAASCGMVAAANELPTSSEDADCNAHADSILPADAHDVLPDGHPTKKQLSDIANNIEDLQSWIHSVNSDVQSNVAGDGAGLSLSVVDQYASELQKKKNELDQINTQVKELEKIDKNVVWDERCRLVSVHAQLHSLSASLNTIASEAVRIR